MWVRQLGIEPQMTCKAPLQWWRCSVMSGVLIQGTYLPGVGPTDRSSSTDETLLHLLAFFDYLPRVFLLAWTHWRSLFLPVLLDSCMSDTHFYFFQQVPHGGNKWGGVGEGDDTGWLIHLIWLMTMRTGAYNSNDKQTLLGPQDMTITHVRMREGCWALLLLSRIFFPPSPPAASFSSKSMRYILVQWRRRKKIVLMIAQVIIYQCFFFLGSLCQSYNTFVKEKGHI